MGLRQLKTTKLIKKFKEEFFNTEEGKKMIKQKLNELEDDSFNLKNDLISMNESASVTDDRNDWLYETMIEEQEKKIKTVNSKIWRLKKIDTNDVKEGWFILGEQEDIDIEEIKKIPIGNLIESEAYFSGHNRMKYLCPLHDEKTASFVWYQDSNSWYCFGACKKGGDIIQLFMEMNECSFYQAIKQLKVDI